VVAFDHPVVFRPLLADRLPLDPGSLPALPEHVRDELTPGVGAEDPSVGVETPRELLRHRRLDPVDRLRRSAVRQEAPREYLARATIEDRGQWARTQRISSTSPVSHFIRSGSACRPPPRWCSSSSSWPPRGLRSAGGSDGGPKESRPDWFGSFTTRPWGLRHEEGTLGRGFRRGRALTSIVPCSIL
jgi:hypothetical protein